MPFKKKEATASTEEAAKLKAAPTKFTVDANQAALDFVQQLVQSNDGVAARLFLDIYTNSASESHQAALIRAQQGTQALIKLSHIAT